MNDEKDAVNIGVTLSSQLVTAALAMIAVVGTFATFVIDKRNVGIGYYLVAGGAFFSFVVSIFLGGKGIDKARKNGFSGNWNLVDTKGFFNGQAFFALLGIALFAISVFLGKEKSLDAQNKLEMQTKIIAQLRISDSLNRIKLSELNKKIDSVSKNSIPEQRSVRVNKKITHISHKRKH